MHSKEQPTLNISKSHPLLIMEYLIIIVLSSLFPVGEGERVLCKLNPLDQNE